jgi:hypothetical protein
MDAQICALILECQSIRSVAGKFNQQIGCIFSDRSPEGEPYGADQRKSGILHMTQPDLSLNSLWDAISIRCPLELTIPFKLVLSSNQPAHRLRLASIPWTSSTATPMKKNLSAGITAGKLPEIFDGLHLFRTQMEDYCGSSSW